jgi:tRNA(adenine34) deaminase
VSATNPGSLFNLSDLSDDEKWMREALLLAERATQTGDVPVGALIVRDGEVIAASHNRKEERNNPLAHAEILAIEEASRRLGCWRLSGCTLYVTLEPCLMCAGAIIHGRIDRVVYATPDPKTGAVDSLYSVLADARLNHSPVVVSGVLRDEAATMLKSFFRRLRDGSKSEPNS